MPYVRCWIVNILITFKVIIVERKQKKKINKITNIFLLFKFLSFRGRHTHTLPLRFLIVLLHKRRKSPGQHLCFLLLLFAYVVSSCGGGGDGDGNASAGIYNIDVVLR